MIFAVHFMIFAVHLMGGPCKVLHFIIAPSFVFRKGGKAYYMSTSEAERRKCVGRDNSLLKASALN